MKKCFIIAGGDFDGFYDFIGGEDFVIAADKGYTYARNSGISCDLIIGDFDSSDMPKESDVVKLNPIKDYTDTMAAMMIAKEKGFREIIIYGSLGGRESHTIANIKAALEYKKQGIDVRLKSKDKALFIIDKSFTYEFKDEEDFYVSIFSLSEISKNVTIKGLYYELNNYDMTIFDSLGVSNETVNRNFTISLEDGYLLLIFEKKNS